MRPAHFFRLVFLLCVAFLGAPGAPADDIKSIHPTSYVTDLAGVIGANKQAGLEALCTELEQKTGAQLAVVTVRSLDGESVETYAVDLFKQQNAAIILLRADSELL